MTIIWNTYCKCGYRSHYYGGERLARLLSWVHKLLHQHGDDMRYVAVAAVLGVPTASEERR